MSEPTADLHDQGEPLDNIDDLRAAISSVLDGHPVEDAIDAMGMLIFAAMKNTNSTLEGALADAAFLSANIINCLVDEEWETTQ